MGATCRPVGEPACSSVCKDKPLSQWWPLRCKNPHLAGPLPPAPLPSSLRLPKESLMLTSTRILTKRPLRRNRRVFSFILVSFQTEHAVSVAPLNLGLDVPPEGLEPFFCPCLPASGRGLCACLPVGQGGTRAGRLGGGDDGVGGDGRRRGRCRGVGLSPPPPRLFTFAAPGRSGAGMFYGACLSVFR